MFARFALLLAFALIPCSTGCAIFNKGCNNGLPFGADCASCQTDCGSCGGAGCHECLAAVKKGIHDKLTCGSGCGSLVLDEWFDNPPDCCDPCDAVGGWTGNRLCPPKIFTHHNMYGVRTCGPDCTTCEIDGKGGGKGIVLEGSVGESSVLEHQAGPPRATRPTEAASPAATSGAISGRNISHTERPSRSFFFQ